jgi:H+/Cl- antiporter ClcA
VSTPSQQPSPGAFLRLVALGALIGIPAAFVAAVFLGFVHDLEGWIWDDLPDALGYSSPPWFLVLGLLVVGAALVIAARRLLPGDGGHPPMRGLSMEPTPVAYAPSVILAAIGTLAFGAVLGPEMPVIALGSAVGMLVVRFVKVGRQETTVLSTAGAFSAISALFGGPIVAGMLLVEGGLAMGAALLPALLPGFVAAAIGYVIFVGFGDWGGLSTPGLVVPHLPLYDGVHAGDLAVAIVVGVGAALIITAVRGLATGVDALRPRLGMAPLLLAGGFAVGALAEIADLLGDNSQDVLFSGQSSVPVVAEATSTKVVVILLVAKFLAYGVSLGCGYRGGPIFPAVFLGVALMAFPVVWFDASPTLAIAVGAAAGMAAQTRLLISPVLFASLLVGSQGTDAIPAAVIATAAAWLAMAALERRRTPSPSPV